ncbi:MAG TPA: (2Fe-2S) ferredoxin domain-containing protein [Kofleriaceae bacterium]|nr:(2Fe-2S) ferredoxin domain-containing protein [Kofleriaceae bacterium]
MPTFLRHVFVCINERAPDHPKGSCKLRGGVEVRDRLKAELSARGLGKRIRANNAGCLDQCEQGVTVVVYPEQVWYGHVTVEDIPEIIEKHLIGGEVVARLLLPDQPHLGGRTSFPSIEIGEPRPEKAAPKPAPKPEPKP